jgi:hypothetical protein
MIDDGDYGATGRMKMAGETEVLGENLPQCHFVHHKSHIPDPCSNPGRRGGKQATNRLSYDTASLQYIYFRKGWKSLKH